MAGSHVEVNGVADLKPHSGPHRGFLSRVEEAHQFEIRFGIWRFIQIAADGEGGTVGWGEGRGRRTEDGSWELNARSWKLGAGSPELGGTGSHPQTAKSWKPFVSP